MALATTASARAKVPLPKPRPTHEASFRRQPPPQRPSPGRLRPRRHPVMRRRQSSRDTPACGPATAATAASSRRGGCHLDDVAGRRRGAGEVIELVRKHKPAEATEVEAAIWDPVARKLAEWIILRSDDNGASVERYRAFIAANPSWPSQTFLRRRLEAALWDDHRDDATVLAWFKNEIAAVRQRQILARPCSDRVATAPMRSAWCATPGATTRCRRRPKTLRWSSSARC